MATSAFKSTTKRSTFGAIVDDSPSSSFLKPSHGYSSSNPSERSRSLNRFPAFLHVDLKETGDSSERFTKTFQELSEFPDISRFPDVLGDEFVPVVGTVGDESPLAGQSPLEAAGVQRRGRSVSRYGASEVKGVVNNGRRRQCSVSVARYQCSYSEIDRDLSGIFMKHSKSKGIGHENGQKDSLHKETTSTCLPNCKCGLRRSLSQKGLQQLHDGYSSYSSALTNDEGNSACCNNNGNEKKIQTVFAQQIDHPIGDCEESGLVEELRKEVRHAIAEIRTELEQVLVKSKSAILGNGGCLESKSTDALEAIAQIRKNYDTKLEQSDKQTRELLSELAIEEQYGREFSKIVRVLIPEPNQSAEPVKPAGARKRTTDRTRMSKCLTEEAERYFEGFLSNVEDMEFTSFEGEASDANPSVGRNARSRDPLINKLKPTSGQGPTSVSSLPVDTDGVVLPWLEWETSNEGTPVPVRTNTEKPMSSQEGISDSAQVTLHGSYMVRQDRNSNAGLKIRITQT